MSRVVSKGVHLQVIEEIAPCISMASNQYHHSWALCRVDVEDVYKAFSFMNRAGIFQLVMSFSA
jgi:hypothetical protein